MNVLITGISGFAGSHLTEYLVSLGKYKIHGIYQSEASLPTLDKVKDQVSLYQVDLLDKEKTAEVVGLAKPDLIFHLAALSSPRKSFEDPSGTITNNVDAEINLLEGVRKGKLLDTKILIISSAEIYGLVNEENIPIDEQTPLNPTNPYAVSKIAQDYLGLQYFNSYGLQVIRVRPFNHFGPRQTDAFVIASLCRKIAELEKSKIDVIKVGNLEAKRDFTDVRDMVKAYVLAVEKGVPGDVYNIGSGKSYPIKEILEKLIELSGAKVKIETDKSLFLPLDNPNLVCNLTKFNKLTGWVPSIPLEKSLKDTLDYWRDIA